mmetsp:Transcript_4435/g.10629  ORF Transcript_4435/g.10629 Transcript_4435/m.10629 type:complete len:255 (-) Transcript_4435:1523-2287(-)
MLAPPPQLLRRIALASPPMALWGFAPGCSGSLAIATAPRRRPAARCASLPPGGRRPPTTCCASLRSALPSAPNWQPSPAPARPWPGAGLRPALWHLLLDVAVLRVVPASRLPRPPGSGPPSAARAARPPACSGPPRAACATSSDPTVAWWPARRLHPGLPPPEPQQPAAAPASQPSGPRAVPLPTNASSAGRACRQWPPRASPRGFELCPAGWHALRERARAPAAAPPALSASPPTSSQQRPPRPQRARVPPLS